VEISFYPGASMTVGILRPAGALWAANLRRFVALDRRALLSVSGLLRAGFDPLHPGRQPDQRSNVSCLTATAPVFGRCLVGCCWVNAPASSPDGHRVRCSDLTCFSRPKDRRRRPLRQHRPALIVAFAFAGQRSPCAVSLDRPVAGQCIGGLMVCAAMPALGEEFTIDHGMNCC